MASSADLTPTTTNAAQDSQVAKASPSPPVVRDDSFYFSIVVFRVENTLFKIPSHILSDHSDVFQAMFSLPIGESIAGGLTDDDPIVLEGITSFDFKQLLKALYSQTVLSPWTSTIPNQVSSQLPVTLEEWTPVLRLSDQWNMTAVHQFAIEKMAVMSMDPVDRLALALEFDIKPWMMPALNALAQRPEPIVRRDIDKLRLDVVLQIVEVRESFHRSSVNGQAVVGKRQVGQTDFSSRIMEVFSAQFKPLKVTFGERSLPKRPRVALPLRSPQHTQPQGSAQNQIQPTPAPSTPFTFNLAGSPPST